MSRPKKPTKLKVLQGTYRKDRELSNQVVLDPVKEVPQAPEWLNDYGIKQFDLAIREIYKIGIVAEVDLALLAAYANEMGNYIEMEKDLKENGRLLVFYNDDGSIRYSQQKPEVSMSKQSLKYALQLASQFGFTPAGRTKIGVPEKEEDDELEMLKKYLSR